MQYIVLEVNLICKICNKDINDKFYKHINSHKWNLKKYFLEFPEQKEDYYNNKPEVWNKGQTAENNVSVEKYRIKIIEYSNREDIKKKRSDLLKKRYEEQGDIISKEQRLCLSKKASDAWVNKLKNSSQEERIKLLEPFTTAGNKAQNDKRPFLTPEDYKRKYPFGKGEPAWHNCDFCSNRMIIWIGGKKRSSKNFCDKDCYDEYLKLHPLYCLGGKRIIYNSTKMNREFYLLSKLEKHIAEILDKSDVVKTWEVCPHVIKYEYDKKERKYYPDFLINENLILEVKSDFVFSLNAPRTIVKLNEANKWCLKNDFVFIYWEFRINNITLKKVENDPRVRKFLLGRD